LESSRTSLLKLLPISSDLEFANHCQIGSQIPTHKHGVENKKLSKPQTTPPTSEQIELHHHHNHTTQTSLISRKNSTQMDQAINQLTPQQRQAVMMQAQQEANQQIMQGMIEKMVSTCFKTCAGTSVGFQMQY